MAVLTKKRRAVSYAKKEARPCANADNKHVEIDNKCTEVDTNVDVAEYEYDDPRDSPYYEEDKWLYDQADEILKDMAESEEEYRLGKRRVFDTTAELWEYLDGLQDKID